MEYENLTLSNDELAHHGTLGMKWGVRRYQNKDGSLTPRGKKKYQKEMAKVKEQEAILKRRRSVQAKLDKLAERKKAVKEGNEEMDLAAGKKPKKEKPPKEPKQKDFRKKSLKDMTDEEIQTLINRGRLEQQYKQLYPDPVPKKNRLVNDVIVPAAIDSGKKFATDLFKSWGDNLLKGNLPKEIDYDKEIKKINYENAKKNAAANEAGHMNYWKMKEAERTAASTKTSTSSTETSSSSKSSKSSKSSFSLPTISFKNADSGKKVVSDSASTKISSLPKTSKLANDPDWQAFKEKYSWGVETYAMDEVRD